MTLWFTILVLAVDLATEVMDVLNERKSRASLGGLPSSEYLVHIMLTTLRVAALSLAFAALPDEAWRLNSDATILLPELSKSIAMLALPGGILVALLHVYLIFDSMLVSRVEKFLRSKLFNEL